MRQINATHNRELTSWIESANKDSNFPIQNLPFCVFQHATGTPSIGVGIGDQIFNLRMAASAGLFTDEFIEPLSSKSLNLLMAMTVENRVDLRNRISNLLATGADATTKSTVEKALVYQSDVEFRLPCVIGDYTDFYASLFHATNVGTMFRPNNPLMPNYKHIPIGYHGRSSSVVVSGTNFHRPIGQLTPAEEGGNPTRSACKLMDYELEIGALVAQGNDLGHPIPIDEAEDYLFGLTLMNDWSARDIQKWEYQPLGPFLGKSFATSISPWVITLEALAPFRCPGFERSQDDPPVLDYLTSESNSISGGFDLQLEVHLRSEKMRAENVPALRISQGSFSDLYWTFSQMLTHHSSNGCNLRPGDMLGSGTVSGVARASRGCLLELTWDGDRDNPVAGSQRTPIVLPTGEERKFLADGDELIITGFCENADYIRIGLGSCSGIVLPPVE
ncbi:MAG: fumarylacetoacetase [Planctomycetota bacterium]